MPLSTHGFAIGSALNRHVSSFVKAQAWFGCKLFTPLSFPLGREYQSQAQNGIHRKLDVEYGASSPEGHGSHSVWQSDAVHGNDEALDISIESSTPPLQQPKLRITGISNRRLKRLRSSPTASLISAIRAIDQNHPALPIVPPNKSDLSYVDPKKGPSRKKSRNIQSLKLESSSNLPTLAKHRTDLTSVLAGYIRSITINTQPAPQALDLLERDELKVLQLDDESTKILNAKGYREEDVKLWASIIMARDVQYAVKSLLDSQIKDSSNPRRPIPDFVFLFILRRSDISADALRKLIEHAWYRFGTGVRADDSDDGGNAETRSEVSQEPSSQLPQTAQKSNEMTIVLAVIRLLRHARILWPESMTNIVQLITKCLQPFESTKIELQGTRYRQLCFLYNRLLSLLSIPSSIHPFASVVHRQRAQFTLVQRMMEFSPPVLLKREGYRAIIAVQAAHKKTSREREWADLKAHSWPPWKHERTGLDVDKGIDMGITRSVEVIHQLEEAGYPSQSWEQTARIYSGWDTDDTPTIQTRTILGKPSVKGRHTSKSLKQYNDISSESQDIWAARIRSTRTVQEAWACFLALKDGGLPSSEAYYAMLEKLVLGRAQKRKRTYYRSHEVEQRAFENTIFPGDRKEPFPAPISPQEAIYIPSAPPSPIFLFNQMLEQGATPTVRCTSFLVSHSESLAQGILYLRKSRIHPIISHAMVNVEEGLLATRNVSRDDMNKVPRLVSAALIRLLCRFPRPPPNERTQQENRAPFSFTQVSATKDRQRTNPFLQAISLLRLWSPSYRPPWNDVLSALASEGTCISDFMTNPSKSEQLFNDLLSWRYIQSLVAGMVRVGLSPDIQTFQVICVGLQKAAIASYAVQDLEESQISLSAPMNMRSTMIFRSESTLKNGARYVRGIFESVVGCGISLDHDRSASPPRNSTPQPVLPRLLIVPGPAQLHAYVRVLGLLNEWQDLLDLIKWIQKHSQEIEAAAGEINNGKTLMRRTMVAVRVFVEQSPTKSDSKDQQVHSKSHSSTPLTHQLRHEIEQLENWGGWPSNEEVESYLRHSRHTRPHFS